jgi:hypothetical protein
MDDKSLPDADEVDSTWLDFGSAGTADTLYGSKGMVEQPSTSFNDPVQDGSGTAWQYGGAGGMPPPPGVSAIHGTNGNDLLRGTSGNDKLYGGKGHDTLVYSGAFHEYELRFRPEAWDYVLVDKVSGRDGTDLLNLHDIERLQFADQVVLLDDWGGARLEDGTPLLPPYFLELPADDGLATVPDAAALQDAPINDQTALVGVPITPATAA